MKRQLGQPFSGLQSGPFEHARLSISHCRHIIWVSCAMSAMFTLNSSAQELAERPELLPKQVRDERQQDRLDATAHFSSARVLMKQGDPESLAQALRHFQRAYRRDTDSLVSLQNIITVSQTLERYSVAARYAVIAAERQPDNPDLLARIAALLAQQNELPRAATLLEQAIRLREADGPNADVVVFNLELGRIRFLLDDYGRAFPPLKKVADALEHPEQYKLSNDKRKQLLREPTLIYEMMGTTFLHEKQYDLATEMFRKADADKPRPAILTFRLSEVAFEKGDREGAEKLLNDCFAAKFSDIGAEPFLLLERIVAGGKDRTEQSKKTFVERLKKLHAEWPDNATLGALLGSRLVELQQWDEADEIYRKFEKSPSAESFRGIVKICREKKDVARLLMTLGTVADVTGSLDLLGSELGDVIKDAPLMQLIKDLATELRKKDAAPPKNGVPFAAALLAMAGKDYESADHFFDWAMNVPEAPKAQWMMSWGLGMFTSEQASRAAAVFERAIREDVSTKNNHVFHYYLAGALELAGKTDEALVAAAKASEGDKVSPSFQARGPWILYHAKRYAEAETSYKSLIERLDKNYDSDDTRTALREARIVMSSMCANQKRYAEAEEWLEEVLDEFPEDIGAFNDLGYLWAEQNKHLQRALGMIEKACAAEPKNKAYRDSLGWIYFRLGRYQDAVVELEKAIDEKEPDGVVLDHLAEAHFKQQNRDTALATWQRSRDAFRRSHDESEARRIEHKMTSLGLLK